MTQQDAKQQIETIKRITEEALQSPESARKILVDAGIIKDDDNNSDNNGKLPSSKLEPNGIPSALSNHRVS